MTDDNQGPDEQESTPQFGSGVKQETEDKPRFTQEEIEKILNRNSHAQNHIKTLETETATLRDQLRQMQEELAKSKTIEDMLEAMQQQDDTTYDRHTNMSGQTTPQLDKNELLAQLKEEVFKELSAAQRAELEARNWKEAENMLKDKYGERYGFYVDERAKELDMTVEDMESLARTKPKAFMELVGGEKKMTPSPTKSSQMSNVANSGDSVEAMYSRVARLRRDLNSEEGREAAKVWSDPAFQAKYRQHILDKARKEGKF